MTSRFRRWSAVGTLSILALTLTSCSPDNETQLNQELAKRVTTISRQLSQIVREFSPLGAVDVISKTPAFLQAGLWRDKGIHSPFSSPSSNWIYSIHGSATSTRVSVIAYQSLNTQEGWTPKILRSYACLTFKATISATTKVTDAKCPVDIAIMAPNDTFRQVHLKDLDLSN